MKSIHILHSEAATGWGGQEIRVFQESCLLLERGYRVSLICQPGSPLAGNASKIESPDFKCYPIKMGRNVNPFSIFQIYRTLKKIRPDIANTHSSIDSWQVSFCCKALKIPIVRSRHVSIPVKNYFPKKTIYSYFPEKIITSGKAVQAIMQSIDGVRKEKVVSITAGVDMQRFDHNISRETIRAELGLKTDQPLIGKIAVIRGWKGHDYFLESVPRVLEKIPNARFIIVGDGPGFNEIKKKVSDRKLGSSLTLLGYREDVPEIMAGLDILVLASIEGEATSQVIPQAFAMKTPVVATRAGGIPEILDDGKLGVLVETRSGKALADGMLTLLENPDVSQSFVNKAYQFCQQELSIDKMMEQTIAVYEDIIEFYN